MPNENKTTEERFAPLPRNEKLEEMRQDLSIPTKTTEEMEENLSTPEKISNQETQRFEETSKGLNELRNQIPVEERGEGKAKIPPTPPSWEEWVRLLATSNNPRDIELLIAKLKILLSSHIPLEEVVRWMNEVELNTNTKGYVHEDFAKGFYGAKEQILSSLKQKLEERRTNQK